ncbi:MAG: hypothetical protein AAF799_21790 [Myxococcota bacterium]
MRSERRRFWAENGFGTSGGYDDAWQEASFAGVPYAVPNVRARADALRVHDLHHLLTGYTTDWRGESEISGWELGSGGAGRYPYAWFIAMFGFVIGVLTMPLRTWRAFRRGRGGSNLYAVSRPMDVLNEPVERVRARLGVDMPRRHGLGDVFRFVALASLMIPLGLLCLVGTPLLVLMAMLLGVRCPMHQQTPC